jgi:hypothetical protein
MSPKFPLGSNNNDKEVNMRTVTLDQAAIDLKSIIQRTIRDRDETVIASNEGAVVMLDENEWSNVTIQPPRHKDPKRR